MANEYKFKIMDKWQIGLIVGLVITGFVQSIFYFQEVRFLAEHMQEVLDKTITIPESLSIPYSLCSYFSFMFFAWIIIRFITFNKRKNDFYLEHDN